MNVSKFNVQLLLGKYFLELNVVSDAANILVSKTDTFTMYSFHPNRMRLGPDAVPPKHFKLEHIWEAYKYDRKLLQAKASNPKPKLRNWV